MECYTYDIGCYIYNMECYTYAMGCCCYDRGCYGCYGAAHHRGAELGPGRVPDGTGPRPPRGGDERRRSDRSDGGGEPAPDAPLGRRP
eukprot:102799-Prorocentrum_minimum.AAC.2